MARQGNSLQQACPTFLLKRVTFTGKKLLRATCIFTTVKFQLIASFMYEIGAQFGQYFRNLSPKAGEDLKKGLHRISELISGKPNRERVWFGPFRFLVCYKMVKPFHEEFNLAKRSSGQHKTASRAKCGSRAADWAALLYKIGYIFCASGAISIPLTNEAR